MKKIIVSRHSSAIAWLKKRGIEGEVVSQIDSSLIETLQKDDEVYGILPTHLALQILERGVKVFLLQLPNVVFEQRGKELSPEEMEEAGAKILRFGLQHQCHCTKGWDWQSGSKASVCPICEDEQAVRVTLQEI